MPGVRNGSATDRLSNKICQQTEEIVGKLENKIAIVTGGNGGIGFAAAKSFAAEGAVVYITGRRQDELDKAVAEIGQNVKAIQGDVTSSGDLDRLFKTVDREQGRIDVLFANAGRADIGRLDQVTEDDFESLFALNVKSVLFTVQKALPLLSSGASIILNGSMLTAKGASSLGLTAASKAAVRSLARTWAVELKGRNIRVNVVSPGTVITPGYENHLKLNDEQIQKIKQQAADTTPLGRDGSSDEIAKVVTFLASDDSSYMTGTELFVDGGFSQV